jgi:hypothetical protein
MAPTAVATFKYFSLIRGLVQRDDFQIIVPFTYFSMKLQSQKEFSKAESGN